MLLAVGARTILDGIVVPVGDPYNARELVRAGNAPAIALYEKLGFTPVGRRKDFYRDPVEDALLMTRFFDKGEGK